METMNLQNDRRQPTCLGRNVQNAKPIKQNKLQTGVRKDVKHNLIKDESKPVNHL